MGRTSIVHFTKNNEVSLQYFTNGRKCFEEYESLLSGIRERKEELAKVELEKLSNKKPRLSSSVVPGDSTSPPRAGQSMGLLLRMMLLTGRRNRI